MRFWSIFTSCLALSSLVLVAQAGGVKAKDPALQAAIDARQHAIDTRNPSEWAKYTAEEFVSVSVDGVIRSRERRLKDLASPPTVTNPKVTMDSVRMFGPDAAVSIQRTSNNTRISLFWIRQGGAWKAISSQTSPITGK